VTEGRQVPFQPGEVDLRGFGAMLFDLDGVVTRTASVHAAAWKALFDDFLREWAAEHGEPYRPFDADRDYRDFVDGRRRHDGVTTFLASRGITLPAGAPGDEADERSVAGLGRRKDGYFVERLAAHGVEVFDDAVVLVRALHRLGKVVAIVSASENCVPVLERAGILDLFPVRVTGVEAAALGLPGKPAPDTFLEAARRAEVPPERAVVFEDALAGVEAGAAGGFGLVVGVDRVGSAAELLRHGADVVVADLSTLIPRDEGSSTPRGDRS
jgi:beta-phosphoglucomutase family hydrolase